MRQVHVRSVARPIKRMQQYVRTYSSSSHCENNWHLYVTASGIQYGMHVDRVIYNVPASDSVPRRARVGQIHNTLHGQQAESQTISIPGTVSSLSNNMVRSMESNVVLKSTEQFLGAVLTYELPQHKDIVPRSAPILEAELFGELFHVGPYLSFDQRGQTFGPYTYQVNRPVRVR